MVSSYSLVHPGLWGALTPDDATRLETERLDDVILARAACHSREAYAELYDRYVLSVYRYFLAYVGHVQDAQDLTAQTFLAGLEGIATYRATGAFAAWLFGIAHRKAMDYFRRSRDTVSLDELTETPHPDQLPEQIIEERLDYEQLSAAIRMLAPDRADAITLRIFAQLSVTEIAELMGRHESAVRMLLSRAISDLRRKMGPTQPSADGERGS
jgi:RNA polymerase sigma-70 factor (ECF subfamily)